MSEVKYSISDLLALFQEYPEPEWASDVSFVLRSRRLPFSKHDFTDKIDINYGTQTTQSNTNNDNKNHNKNKQKSQEKSNDVIIGNNHSIHLSQNRKIDFNEIGGTDTSQKRQPNPQNENKNSGTQKSDNKIPQSSFGFNPQPANTQESTQVLGAPPGFGNINNQTSFPPGFEKVIDAPPGFNPVRNTPPGFENQNTEPSNPPGFGSVLDAPPEFAPDVEPDATDLPPGFGAPANQTGFGFQGVINGPPGFAPVVDTPPPGFGSAIDSPPPGFGSVINEPPSFSPQPATNTSTPPGFFPQPANPPGFESVINQNSPSQSDSENSPRSSSESQKERRRNNSNKFAAYVPSRKASLPEPSNPPIKAEPAPRKEPSFDPKPAADPTFNPKPAAEPTFNSKPAQEPTFNPRPAQEPSFNPRPAQEPSFKPKPATEPTFNPRPVQQQEPVQQQPEPEPVYHQPPQIPRDDNLQQYDQQFTPRYDQFTQPNFGNPMMQQPMFNFGNPMMQSQFLPSYAMYQMGGFHPGYTPQMPAFMNFQIHAPQQPQPAPQQVQSPPPQQPQPQPQPAPQQSQQPSQQQSQPQSQPQQQGFIGFDSVIGTETKEKEKKEVEKPMASMQNGTLRMKLPLPETAESDDDSSDDNVMIVSQGISWRRPAEKKKETSPNFDDLLQDEEKKKQNRVQLDNKKKIHKVDMSDIIVSTPPPIEKEKPKRTPTRRTAKAPKPQAISVDQIMTDQSANVLRPKLEYNNGDKFAQLQQTQIVRERPAPQQPTPTQVKQKGFAMTILRSPSDPANDPNSYKNMLARGTK